MASLDFRRGISCESARPQFDALLRGELDVEQRGRVKGHVLSCESCAQAYGEAVVEAMERGQLATQDIPPLSAPPAPVLEAIGVRHRNGGIRWAQICALAGEGIAWAQAELDTMGKALQDALSLWILPQPRWAPAEVTAYIAEPSTEDAAWPQHMDVNIVNSAGQHQERTVHLEIIRPPTVPSDGTFLFSVRSDEMGLQGCMLLCAVEVAQQVFVTFDGELRPEYDSRGWQVTIKADGLPAGKQDVVIPEEQVRLALQRSEPHAS
jgi:hypothetical protein